MHSIDRVFEPGMKAKGYPMSRNISGQHKTAYYPSVIVMLIGVAGLLAGCEYQPYSPPPVAFSGPSTNLKATVIQASLDQPMPKGKNVVWCGSFQEAWTRLKDDVVKAPIQIDGRAELCGWMNNPAMTLADLPTGSYFSIAGKANEEIFAKITAEMARRFPHKTVTWQPPKNDPHAFVAYAYLEAAVKFAQPLFDHAKAVDFTDSAGRDTPVGTFGFYAGDEDASVNRQIREQIAVLYEQAMTSAVSPNTFQCVLDMDAKSPTQLILALVPPQATLAKTLEYVQQKTQDYKGPRQLTGNELVIPNLNWKIDHEFAELQGTDKILLNRGWENYFVSEARQITSFRLDRSGAAVASESWMGMRFLAMPMAPRYHFTRPFLIIMKNRASKTPFFVMWVDNAELLCKKQPVVGGR
jgi:hypothetical protein